MRQRCSIPTTPRTSPPSSQACSMPPSASLPPARSVGATSPGPKRNAGTRRSTGLLAPGVAHRPHGPSSLDSATARWRRTRRAAPYIRLADDRIRIGVSGVRRSIHPSEIGERAEDPVQTAARLDTGTRRERESRRRRAVRLTIRRTPRRRPVAATRRNGKDDAMPARQLRIESRRSACWGWRGRPGRTAPTHASAYELCRPLIEGRGYRDRRPVVDLRTDGGYRSIPCSTGWTTATSPATRSGTARRQNSRVPLRQRAAARSTVHSRRDVPGRDRRRVVRLVIVTHARAHRQPAARALRVEANRPKRGPPRTRPPAPAEHVPPPAPRDGARAHRGGLRTLHRRGRPDPCRRVRRPLRPEAGSRSAVAPCL